MSAAPALVFGGAIGGEGAVLYRCDGSGSDAGEPIVAKATPRATAPAGARGEVALHNIYLALQHQSALDLKVTPVLDDEVVEGAEYAFEAPSHAKPTRETLEIPVTVPYESGGVVWSYYAPRGRWVSVVIEAEWVGEGEDEGELTIDGIEIELEVVREGLTPPAR